MNEETEYKFNAREVLESLACGDPYLRRCFIGASDAPAIMGVSPWKTPYRLWQEKCGLVCDAIPNEAMQRGHRLEPIARSLFEEIIGVSVQPKRFFSDTYDWMMASLDGINYLGNVAVEIKCPYKYYNSFPSNYIPQLQHQMFVAGLNEMWYFSFVEGDKNFMELIKRDDEYIEELIQAEIEFWECVKTCTPPKLTKKDYIQRNDLEWLGLAEEWRILQEEKKSLLKQEEDLKNEIIEACKCTQTMGNGIKAQKIYKKGYIDYSSIYELQSIDLEKYRKEGSEYWKITLSEEE